MANIHHVVVLMVCTEEATGENIEKAAKLLSREEFVRAKKFRNKIDIWRTLLGRLLAKKSIRLLARETNCLYPQNITFFIGPNGKPRSNAFAEFSISHSGSWVVAAACAFPVGIDVAQIEPVPLNAFQTCFSSQEWEHILKSLEPLREFYKLWALKESCVKALGLGIDRMADLEFPVCEEPLKCGTSSEITPITLKKRISDSNFEFCLFYADDCHVVSVCCLQNCTLSTKTLRVDDLLLCG